MREVMWMHTVPTFNPAKKIQEGFHWNKQVKGEVDGIQKCARQKELREAKRMFQIVGTTYGKAMK